MKQIYGYGETTGGGLINVECSCEPSVPLDVVLNNFLSTITQLKKAVGQFYPIVVFTTPFIGFIPLTAKLPLSVIVRLEWINVYGSSARSSAKFDKTNQLHLIQLKDIYLAFNKDWRQDPLFK